MKRVGLAVLLFLGFSATLAAQRPAVGIQPDARLGAGGIRPTNPNILYPGSPSGGRPGSVITPGTPRSPGASQLPATPGVGSKVRPRPPRYRRKVFRRGAYIPVYGYGYGGVYMDSGDGPVEVEQEEEGSKSEYVVTVPPKKPAPNPRVYDIRETADGQVEMRDFGGASAPVARPRPDYWLIALNGGLIYAAERYWQQDETFRFTTVEGKEFVVSPSELDLAFTARLNADLGREFIEP